MSHIYLMSANLTTNEYVNWVRYKYLINEEMKFNNDFDVGMCSNIYAVLCNLEKMYLPPTWLPLEAEHDEYYAGDVDPDDGPCPYCQPILLTDNQRNKKSCV